MIFSENDNELAEKAIKLGLNIRDDFWEDFIRVTNNPTALGELLGINSGKILSWGKNIRKYLQKVKKDRSSEEKPKKKMLNTGNHDNL